MEEDFPLYTPEQSKAELYSALESINKNYLPQRESSTERFLKEEMIEEKPVTSTNISDYTIGYIDYEAGYKPSATLLDIYNQNNNGLQDFRASEIATRSLLNYFRDPLRSTFDTFDYEDVDFSFVTKATERVETPQIVYPTPAQTHAETAHRFRTRRLREGPMNEFIRSLQQNTDTKQLIGALTSQREVMGAMNKSEDTIHRTLTPFLAGIMNQPESRQNFMTALDQTVQAESSDLKEIARENGGLSVDVVIVGAGVQSAVAAARLRADNPALSILVVDKRDHIGGQFRSYGTRPTFKINSRAHRPNTSSEDTMALPGGNSNLNPLSKASILQIPDITSETYPTNLEIGDTAAANLFFAAPSMLGVEVMSRQDSTDGIETLILRDTKTEEEYIVNAQAVMILTGAGERNEERVSDTVWTAEELLQHFGNKSEKFPMKAFVGKNIAIIGGGDTGRIAAELFTRLAPRDAYGNSVAQLGGPESISWYGVKFDSREEFCEMNRSRYSQLQAFIANKGEALDGARIIQPIKAYTNDITPTDSGAVKVTDTDGRNRYFDYVIDARNLTQTEIEIQGTQLRSSPEMMTLDGIGMAVVGKRISDTNILFGGPAANVSLTAPELDSFPRTIRENTVAIWANAPRVDLMAGKLAKETTPRRTTVAA